MKSLIQNMRTDMKHNKKRNTGLLYEFLARHAAEGLVENNQKKVKQSVKLMKRFFREGTELHKEFRLFRALTQTSVDSKETAHRIIETTRRAVGQYDTKKLDKEKSLLIKSINHTFNDAGFYDKKINEYKLFATVQVLLNEWREHVPTDVVMTALYEEELVEHLTTPKKMNLLDEAKADNVDDLIVNLMVKKVNTKYDGLLNNEQIALMNSYANGLRNDDLKDTRESIEGLRLEMLGAIDDYARRNEKNPEMLEKLVSLKPLISDPVTSVDDRILTRYLRLSRLKQEIKEI